MHATGATGGYLSSGHPEEKKSEVVTKHTSPEVTQYENLHKPNNVSSHTLYHVRLATLFSPSFSLHANKEKFMLDNIIVCYLKLQGTLTLAEKVGDYTHLTLTERSELTAHKCKVYFRTGPGYETMLASFVPKEDCLYEVMVKPNPREENSFCMFSVREVKTEQERKEFLQRCEMEEHYYRKKSLENKKTLVSELTEAATLEEVNDELLERVSIHLTAETSSGRRYVVPSGSGGGVRRPVVKKIKYY